MLFICELSLNKERENMESLKIENLYKSYGKTEVLKGINFSLEDGEFLVLVGPSGCGKSTLLAAIAGLNDISSGDIYFKDKMLTDTAPKDRDLAMVFQSYALYPNMDVRGNIEFGLRINKFSKEEIEKRVMKSSKILHIDDLLDRKPGQLSGGQRQRVAIARAISREPSMYLFDEPLSNLDAELRVKMRAEIKKLHKNVKKTMVYVTHDQVEAMTLADKVAVMYEGKIQQFGSPEEIYNNPCNVFTAGFMGSPSMNLVEVEIKKEGQKYSYELVDNNGLVNTMYVDSSNQNLDAYVGKKVIAGLRASHIQNGFRDIDDGENIQDFTANVIFSELTGSDLFVHMEVNDTGIVARVSSTLEVVDGSNIELQFKSDKTIFFNIETQQRIR
jgi:multiple sugar transport system ATP-binding protein